MSGPLVELTAVVKSYGGPQPLRVNALRLDRGDRYTLAGFDAGAAETLIHLITGAALPDEGDVRIAGTSTCNITTDTAWLASLDRFGLVTERAVLIEKITLADNLALPLTLSIDPIPDSIRPQVEQLANEVGLPPARLTAIVETLAPAERARLHLARAIATRPAVVLFEHSTKALDAAAAASLGVTLRQVADARGLGWIVFSEDERFAKAAGGKRLRLDSASGKLLEAGLLKRWFG
ncbi:MAG TPA: ATP-binding cassette domain-containing protein [Vicinamibacterales bacterium]|nr:ATP-binding cassette domain-containing protein [Vicinamibacterales bacterium]